MQLIETYVGNSTEGLITVAFQGEGGEMVSVTMTDNGNLDGDDAAVLHAKALMVQLTTFSEDRDPAEDEWERSPADQAQRTDGRPHSKAEVLDPGLGNATATPGPVA